MNIALPEPLTPADCDLRDFGYMPLAVEQLLDSETWLMASGDEAKAAITLWCKSWHQVPAASIPNNDKILGLLSGAGAKWKKVKEVALRGFTLCSDGRLYHRVLAEKATESWAKKLSQRERTKAASDARHGHRNGERNVSRNDQRNDVRNGERNDQRNGLQGKVREGKGSEKTKPSAAVPRSSPAMQLCDALGIGLDNPNWPADVAKWLGKGGFLPDLLEAARREKERGNERKPLGWFTKIADDAVKPARLLAEKNAGREQWGDRMTWLKAYAMDGRWAKNTSENCEWVDALGAGPPPHDPKTLVTAEELALVPGAAEMRERMTTMERTTA